MAARVCEPMAESIEPGEIARRAKATWASKTFRTARGKSAGVCGAIIIGFNSFWGADFTDNFEATAAGEVFRLGLIGDGWE